MWFVWFGLVNSAHKRVVAADENDDDLADAQDASSAEVDAAGKEKEGQGGGAGAATSK
jgi:hypothetical protein